MRITMGGAVRSLSFLISIASFLTGCVDAAGYEPRDGDIIFPTSRSSQSGAIQRATRSPYSHMGIV